VTIYAVAIDHRTHTCPADPEPHTYDTRRTVVHITPGGPCRRPVTIRCGATTATLPCGRNRPAGQHCVACRTIVVEHTITARYDGQHGPEALLPAPAAPALAARSCRYCGDPLAAGLACRGRHLLCPPVPGWKVAA
jgi:hypothetical protein